MVRAECYYHVVWATHRRQPVISDAMEHIAFESILQKSHDMACQVVAINGMPDHVHVIVRIPPAVAVAEWVQRVKGLSSRDVNQANPPDSPRFQWQTGYGVFTISPRNLHMAVDYVKRQKEHHASDSVIAALESTGDE